VASLCRGRRCVTRRADSRDALPFPSSLLCRCDCMRGRGLSLSTTLRLCAWLLAAGSVVSDSHIGVSLNYRRGGYGYSLLSNSLVMGTTAASSTCTQSSQCRAMTMADMPGLSWSVTRCYRVPFLVVVPVTLTAACIAETQPRWLCSSCLLCSGSVMGPTWRRVGILTSQYTNVGKTCGIGGGFDICEWVTVHDLLWCLQCPVVVARR
jgi:hypothetical protein